MTFERGILAIVDGKILTELDHGDGVRLVKAPLSKAAWSTWRRYCQALGRTMGRAIAGLIVHELGTLIGTADQRKAAYVTQLQDQLIARSEALDVREQRLDERERSLRAPQRLVRARTRPIDIAELCGRRSQRSMPMWIRLQVQAMPRLTTTPSESAVSLHELWTA